MQAKDYIAEADSLVAEQSQLLSQQEGRVLCFCEPMWVHKTELAKELFWKDFFF